MNAYVTPAREEAIRASALTRRFGAVVAVDRLDLSVGRGEIFGLIGPDGSGKTTIIRMLVGVVRPSGGWAQVAGCDIRKQQSLATARIGYMAQRFSLYGDLTVSENLGFFGELFGVPRSVMRQREEMLLQFARLAEFRGRRASQLSGGMQKKLSLACSLVHQPEIVFLDEPTTGVDPLSRREFWDILAALHLQGTTVLVSTPYMDEAERCSRVGLIYRGRMESCNAPEQIKGMLAGELLELRASPLRVAQEALSRMEGVLEVQPYGDLLHIFVDDAAHRERSLALGLGAVGVEVLGMRRIKPRMEEAFVSLVRRQVASDAHESRVAQ